MCLTKTFDSLNRTARTLDNKATGILDHIREQNINTLREFDAEVREAYKAKGWNTTRGRKASSNKAKPVPAVVKVYVSEARAAFRNGLNVAEFRNWYELRSALKEARKAKREPKKSNNVHQLPELRGVKVSEEQRVIGATWHDAIVVYEALEGEEREAMERSLQRLLRRFQPKAAPALDIVA